MNNWQLLGVREKVSFLSEIEWDYERVASFATYASERMEVFRQEMRKMTHRGQIFYHRLRVCATWFTLFTLLLEMENNIDYTWEEIELMNLLEERIFSTPPLL